MPRLINADSGVVVNVDDKTAARLVGNWKPAGKSAEPKRKPKARQSSKSDD